MKKIAFLGTGAMGSRMVRQLLDKGYIVNVWNRTTDTAKVLIEDGAKVSTSITEAAEGADCVISMLRDDKASKDVWLDAGGALQAMPKHAIAVECSTVSLPYIKKLHRAFEQTQRRLVDAPLAGSRPQAEAAQLIFFAGAEKNTFQTIEPVLNSMGSQVHHAGAPGSGVVVKLMVNALLGTQLALMAELLGFAQQSGIDVSHAVEMIGGTPVCSIANKISAQAMLKKQFAAAFPIELVAKDFSLIEDSVESVMASAPLCAQVKSIYEKGIDAGLAEYNITAIAQLYNMS
ncbi:NAD(P)-dependent oxidoreductase [Marinicella sp. W31]|uniref:NAD(P)-dependent oxidoreductase n=1 Tax=Marinicella sp. W31 TaxID=3023713 RepID=UPI003757D0AC